MWTPDDFEIRIKRVHHQRLGDTGREEAHKRRRLRWSRYTPGATPGTPKPVIIAAGATTTHDTLFEVHGSLRAANPSAMPATILRERSARDDCGTWQPMGPRMH